jgi:ribosome-binding protein aMBF1 (putative translation factor)
MAAYLGVIPCPICGREARAAVMKTGRVCVTCNHCVSQTMARGDESDQRLRRQVQPPQSKPEEPTQPALPPAQKPKLAESGWGLFP